MDHPRKIIRRAVVDLLTARPDGQPEAWPTDAGRKVYDSRDFTLNTKATPVIVVYTLSEQLDPEVQHDGSMRRRIMTMRVECYDTGDDGAEVVDRMAYQVENVVHANPTIGNRVEWCKLMGTDIGFAGKGELALFAAVMEFEIIYYTHVVEDEGLPPRTVLLGFDPQTGAGNEGQYVTIIGGDDA